MKINVKTNSDDKWRVEGLAGVYAVLYCGLPVPIHTASADFVMTYGPVI